MPVEQEPLVYLSKSDSMCSHFRVLLSSTVRTVIFVSTCRVGDRVNGRLGSLFWSM